ncbi:MAG: ATP-binding cassette domain-containing protein [Pseudomonadota bacterium]
MNRTPPLLEMRDAEIWRGDTRVFESLSLTIAHGESLAIVGPNGAGKSTLAKVLARDIYPVRRAGSFVRLNGMSRFSIWDYRRHIGIVADDALDLLPPGTTVRAAVLSAWPQTAGLRGVNAVFTAAETGRVDELLQTLGLTALTGRRIDSLSTGQYRRVMLARSLVQKPAALVLDEPMHGLDLAALCDYQQTLRTLIRGGTAVVLITHQLHDIPPEIGRVVALAGGVIRHDGRPAEVLTSARLSALYARAIDVSRVGGYFVATPAG